MLRSRFSIALSVFFGPEHLVELFHPSGRDFLCVLTEVLLRLSLKASATLGLAIAEAISFYNRSATTVTRTEPVCTLPFVGVVVSNDGQSAIAVSDLVLHKHPP